MSIEKSPVAAAAHAATSSAGSHGLKSKSASPGSAPAGSGFTGILGALDDAAANTAAPLASAADAADAPSAAAATLPLDVNALLQQNPQIAAAQALQAAADAAVAAHAQGAHMAADAATSMGSGATDAASAAPAVPDPSLLAQQVLAAGVAVAGPGVAGASPASDGPPEWDVRAQTAASGPARARAVDGAPGNATPAPADAAGPGSTPERAQSLTAGLQQAAHTKAGKEALRAGADSSAAVSSNASAEPAEPNKWLAALEQARTPQTAPTLAPLLAPLMARAEKPQSERSGLNAKSAEPTYSGTALGVSAPDFSQSAALVPAMAPDMQAAEQVSYWVAHNVQNAELKLDGLGQSPVEVSISLQGNEAQISFRSDEAATRDVLQSAGVHLKDMLQREGLVLTGVSVGGSGSGNADGSERRPRSNVRQAVIAPLQVAGAGSATRPRAPGLGTAARAVDLFV